MPFWRSSVCCRAVSRKRCALAEVESHDVFRNLAVSMVQHKLGNPAASDAALQTLIDGFAWTAAYQVSEAYAYRGEMDKAFEWLEAAYGSATLAWCTRPWTRSCDRCTPIRAGGRSSAEWGWCEAVGPIRTRCMFALNWPYPV